MMKAGAWIRWALMAIPGLLLAACVTTPAPEGTIGRVMSVRGQKATVNGQPAAVGIWIRSGDHVATGPQSTLSVHFNQGGYMELDENTDPTIEQQWDKVTAGVCLIVRVVFGRVFISGTNICVHDPNLAGLMQSQIVLTTQPGQSNLAVIEGSFSVRTPALATIERHQGLTVLQGRAAVRQLSPAELAEALRWRDKFRSELERAVDAWARDKEKAGADAQPIPPAASGWCCINLEVSPSTRAVCERRKGSFFPRKEDAAQACRVR